MISQPDLFASAAPKVASEEIALLKGLLAGRGWMTAAKIAAELAGTVLNNRPCDLEVVKRRIRAIASADPHILSYPGSPGYRLTKEATIAEIQTATAKLRHQAAEMHARALEIDRVYHAKL